MKFSLALRPSVPVSVPAVHLPQKLIDAFRSDRKINEMRREFLSVASHELRTPLTSLKLQVQMIKRLADRGEISSSSPEVFEKMLNGADKQIGRLTNLIDNLLAASSMKAGELDLELERIEVSELVARVIEKARRQNPLAARYPLELKAGTRAWGYWDKPRLELVIFNLISNATAYGLGKPVVISVLALRDRVKVVIEDQGMGIPQKDQRRIFSPFERAVPSDQYAGLGLGLYVANEITEAHGGRIHLQSEPGTGATFTLELPLFRQAQRCSA